MSSSSSPSSSEAFSATWMKQNQTRGIANGLEPRLEVDDMAMHKELFNLFLLGMEQLQSNKSDYLEKNFWSWLAICGSCLPAKSFGEVWNSAPSRCRRRLFILAFSPEDKHMEHREIWRVLDY
jgi:hypothetical protein